MARKGPSGSAHRRIQRHPLSDSIAARAGDHYVSTCSRNDVSGFRFHSRLDNHNDVQTLVTARRRSHAHAPRAQTVSRASRRGLSRSKQTRSNWKGDAKQRPRLRSSKSNARRLRLLRKPKRNVSAFNNKPPTLLNVNALQNRSSSRASNIAHSTCLHFSSSSSSSNSSRPPRRLSGKGELYHCRLQASRSQWKAKKPGARGLPPGVGARHRQLVQQGPRSVGASYSSPMRVTMGAVRVGHLDVRMDLMTLGPSVRSGVKQAAYVLMTAARAGTIVDDVAHLGIAGEGAGRVARPCVLWTRLWRKRTCPVAILIFC